jgi:type IV pilus assembly protein PilX
MNTNGKNTKITTMNGRRAERQKGAVLIISLLLLLLLTLLAVTAAHRTVLFQKVSANFYDHEMAMQAAETAIRVADTAISATAGGVGSFQDCSPSRTATTPCLNNPFQDANVPASAIITVPTSKYNPGAIAAGQPQYIVQYLGNYPDTSLSLVKQVSNCSGYGSCVTPGYYDFYRVTVRSSDGSADGRAVVVLQSVFRK